MGVGSWGGRRASWWVERWWVSGGMRLLRGCAGALPACCLDRAPRVRFRWLRRTYLRLQVVVVVTTDLKLLCLNHNLQKEWEVNLAVRQAVLRAPPCRPAVVQRWNPAREPASAPHLQETRGRAWWGARPSTAAYSAACGPLPALPCLTLPRPGALHPAQPHFPLHGGIRELAVHVSGARRRGEGSGWVQKRAGGSLWRGVPQVQRAPTCWAVSSPPFPTQPRPSPPAPLPPRAPLPPPLLASVWPVQTSAAPLPPPRPPRSCTRTRAPAAPAVTVTALWWWGPRWCPSPRRSARSWVRSVWQQAMLVPPGGCALCLRSLCLLPSAFPITACLSACSPNRCRAATARPPRRERAGRGSQGGAAGGVQGARAQGRWRHGAGAGVAAWGGGGGGARVARQGKRSTVQGQEASGIVGLRWWRCGAFVLCQREAAGRARAACRAVPRFRGVHAAPSAVFSLCRSLRHTHARARCRHRVNPLPQSSGCLALNYSSVMHPSSTGAPPAAPPLPPTLTHTHTPHPPHPTPPPKQDLGDVQADGRHFSYFAFEGETGALRWMHEVRGGCGAEGGGGGALPCRSLLAPARLARMRLLRLLLLGWRPRSAPFDPHRAPGWRLVYRQ